MKKLKISKLIPKPARYFIDLGKRANSEQGLHNYTSWISVAHALVLGKFLIVSDISLISEYRGDFKRSVRNNS